MNEFSVEQLQAKIIELEKLNQQLKDENTEMAWNEEYGCYTRAGFQKKVWHTIASQARWIIYFDIDGMGELNDKYTHAGVNAIIKKCLTMRASDYKTGQRYSGDEFFVVITDGDPERSESKPIELCMRLSDVMRENGISATFAIAPIVSDELAENVEPAVKLVEKAKAHYQRGTISIVPGEPR